jgi:hypothetical protein
MTTNAQVTVPLGIPDIRVLKTEINERGELIITVESTKGAIYYPQVWLDGGRKKHPSSNAVFKRVFVARPGIIRQSARSKSEKPLDGPKLASIRTDCGSRGRRLLPTIMFWSKTGTEHHISSISDRAFSRCG